MKVKNLNLSFNRLINFTLDRSNYKDLLNVETIDLSSNKMESFYFNSKANIIPLSLKNLIVSNNNIKKFELSKDVTGKLDSLFLDYNGITDFTTINFGNRLIKKLNLKNNKINKIQSNAFGGCLGEEINFENNNIFEILYESFKPLNNTISSKCGNLKVLNLKNNPIKYIDSKFINSAIFANLNEFYIDNYTINNSVKTYFYKDNQIIRIITSNYFIDMPNLQYIQMRSDQIESIEKDALSGLNKLITLALAVLASLP